MDDSHNWRALLYPGEWGFRFFITAALVWLIGWQWHELVAMVIFYALTVGVAVAFVLQAWVLAKFVQNRKKEVEDCQSQLLN